MDTKQKPYLQSIIEKYIWLCENDESFYLNHLSDAIIKDELYQLVQSYENLSEEDQKIIKNYVEIQDSKKLLVEITKKAESLSKNINRLLSGETKEPQKRGLLNMCALLLNIKPRPFDRNHDYTKIEFEKITKPSITKNVKKVEKGIKNSFQLSLVVVVAIVAISFFFTICIKSNKKNDVQGSPITIHTKNFTLSDINRIFPDAHTKFFDQEQKPIVWYAEYKNQPEFFNTYGLHPISGEILKPISEEVINTYIVSKDLLAKNPRNKEKEIPLNTSQVDTNMEKREINSNSILNTSITNTKENKELSLFIFDSILNIETTFENHLRQELTKKYSVTQQLISKNQLSKRIKEFLTQGDIKQLGSDLIKHTDYICVGKVAYKFKQNTILKNKTTCILTINYNIIDVKNGTTIDSYSTTVTGNGSSKDIAKTNTIKKFKL